MDVFMARQPIFNRNQDIYAYELLFRGGMSNFFPDIDGDSATSRLLSSTFFSADIEQITGGKRAFINFTHELLVQNIPLMFPPEVTTVEVLEDVAVDAQLLECIETLSRKGYSIALDDFQFRDELAPLIDLSHIIKVDFRLSSPDEIRTYAERYIPAGIKLLAEKVETFEEFHQAAEMGYSYFQGYFFSKPQVMQDRDIPTLTVNMLQIMSATEGDFDIGRLQELIERDVGVSYKLLRYMNSPYFRRSSEITSIKHAIVMLGETGIKRFLSVIIMSELSADKPDELLKCSIIRARICEHLGQITRAPVSPAELFTMGMFSLIDAILDNSMANIMQKLPLSADIKRCLCGEVSPLDPYLELAASYEIGDWETTLSSAARLGVDSQALPGVYRDALGWADSLILD